MGWFDEQIRERIKNDDNMFSDAFAAAAEAVMPERLKRAAADERAQSKNAIEEILKYYNVKLQELPDNITDINDQLEFLMRPSGIMRRTVKLTGSWYKDASGALLAIRKDTGTVVALIPKGFSGYEFFDITTGRRIKINRKNADLVAEEAVCFYKPLPLSKLSIRDIWKYIFGCVRKRDAVLMASVSAAAMAAGLLIPEINNIIYSYVVTGNSNILLISAFTFLLSVMLSRMLFASVQEITSAMIGKRVSGSLHAAVMMRLLSLPASFFKRRGAGEIASDISYVGDAASMIFENVVTAALTALFSLGYISRMARYGSGIVLPSLAVILFSVCIGIISTVFEIKTMRRAVKAQAREEGLTYSLITGIQKIKLAGAEKRAFSKWALSYSEGLEIKTKVPVIIKISKVVSSCVPLAGTVVIYYLAIKSNMDTADYFAFNSAYAMVAGAFISFTAMLGMYAKIRPMLDAVLPVLETEPEISSAKTVVSRLMGGIELNNISFRYSDNMPYVLDNLSLKIRPGQYVAIVGPSGCGKSTLMRLMLGLEKPVRGAVYYDGRDISSLDLKSLRRRIGTVLQNESLFQGDIYSNISISAPGLTLEEAWDAARSAGIDEDIKNMPMGMNTIIGEGSGGISGGQRQRIIIARAIASKPRILMFDEATSALDNITQKTVSDALDKLKCTRIVIAHRLSTIKNCDRIIVLNNGKIEEEGKYDELIAKNGYFAELVKRQRLDV